MLPGNVTLSVPAGPGRFRLLLTITLSVLAGLAILLRVASVGEPLGIDQSLWASAVRGMARGQQLYRDVWEQRPPGIYFTYLSAFSLFGWTAPVVVWLDVMAAAATTWVIWALARALTDRAAGAVAAAMYAVLTMPAWLYRNGGILERTVCETFVVVCVGFAALSAVRLRRQPSMPMAFAVGLLGGAAALYKPNAGLYFPVILGWGLSPWLGSRQPAAGFLLRAAGVAILGAALLPILTLIWLWRLDLLGEAWTAIVGFNGWYVSQGYSVGAYADKFSHAVFLRMKQDPLWFAGAVATLGALWDLGRTRRLPPLAALAVLWGGTSALVIAVNGMWLFNTYFIQASPPLALLSAWWLTEGSSRSTMRRIAAAATVVAMLGILYQRNYLPKVIGMADYDASFLLGRMDPPAYLERFGPYGKESGYSARANAELADYVHAHTSPDDRIYLFGINGAGVYFLSDRLTAHRFLRVNFYVPDGFPDSRFTLGAVVDELAAKAPAYLIFEQLHSESAMGIAVDALREHPRIRALLQGYTLETKIEDFTLYRRQ